MPSNGRGRTVEVTVADFFIYLANKNYSSWSLRAWLALKQTRVAFKEEVIPLDQPTTREEILRHAPSGKVPALRHGEIMIWESLAIGEYLAELVPDARLWPESRAARAHARAISAEMHAGFMAMRQSMPMNMRTSLAGRRISAEVQDDINRIRYFTAKVSPTPGDAGKLQRQQIYLRALATIPNLSIHLGHFLTNKVTAPLVNPPTNGPRVAMVWRTQEKGSDVNLATYLLTDGYELDYDVAVVVSNDSDLVLPITAVTQKLKVRVGILNPQQQRANPQLSAAATFCKKMEDRALRRSLFPNELQDAHGTFHKPTAW